jgi:hypothetical protein
MAVARRVEWQIGRLLGPPPGKGDGGPGRESLASDSTLSTDDVYKFRLIGTLELEWDRLEPWTANRARPER